MRYAIIIGVLIIAAPLLFRLQAAEQYPDAQSYAQLHASNQVTTDVASNITDYLYHFLPSQLVLIVCAALALIIISLIYSNEIFLLLLVTTPAFIKTFTTVGPAAPALVFITLGAYLAHKKQYWSVLVVPVCFLFSFNLGVLATITIIIIALVQNLPFIALGASFFALLSATATSFLAESITIGFATTTLNDYIGIISGSAGVTVFIVFLSFLGFILQWHEERKTERFITLLIIPACVFFEHGLIILAAFLAFYAGYALTFLANREWHFEELRTITLLLIMCGVLFSTVIEEKERFSVNTERVALVRFVSAAYPQGTMVAAPPEVAPILTYYGYPSGWPVLPQDPSFVASSAREAGYSIIVAKENSALLQHLPIAYTGAYQVYEIS